MNFEQLRTFLWVARLGGVRKASEQMNLSQPAVSARLLALEDTLKVKLFERTPRGVVLTSQGAMLKRYAEQIVFVQEEIRQRIANPTGIEGIFRVGSSETIAQSWLPRFLKQLSIEFPKLSVELTVDISRSLREDLLARRLDLALLMGPVSDYTVENIQLPEFELRWYRAVSGEPVDLTATPIISYSRNTRPYRELVSELSKRYGPGVRVYSCASLSASSERQCRGR
jgi:DNA-binding transcriptional LysR family regulator